uniref:ATP synthase CF0 subunit I n=1 Tax=Kalinella pachyderma TaxID=2704665 RepID=UPI002410F5A0|nr:ATP synthase CF0 subunit I [Kalinella pachyderma]WDY12895.1 ATP synthase CF0 subunit I [Kalinella pachyderma]
MSKALPWTVIHSFSEAITHRQQNEVLLTVTQSYLPLGEGFGFNGNILETNILNLGVVLGIVVSLGGDALRSLLENRKQTISKNLEQAEKRAQEAKERLTQAKFQLETAQKKAVEIAKQGKISAKKERKDSVKRKREEIYRLTEKKEETLRVEEQKAVSQVYRQLVDRVMNKVKQRLATQLDAASHASVINFQIVLLSKYNRITQ